MSERLPPHGDVMWEVWLRFARAGWRRVAQYPYLIQAAARTGHHVLPEMRPGQKGEIVQVEIRRSRRPNKEE